MFKNWFLVKNMVYKIKTSKAKRQICLRHKDSRNTMNIFERSTYYCILLLVFLYQDPYEKLGIKGMRGGGGGLMNYVEKGIECSKKGINIRGALKNTMNRRK